ncbi:Next to BRCA1 protein like [Argiope bruennichi]|uniref:Next to BRCA1 protein like n=1 Tax=Argiope bruennichi TaxID=94029 RepID=A0A8T0F6G9_ARGBR|nr:Next to BRCA1 protein like [Argiope bruennichi]
MRITANIIDEEPYMFTLPPSEDHSRREERKQRKTDSNWFFKNFQLPGKPDRRNSGLNEKSEPRIASPWDPNYCPRIKEVTKKFRNLHLSDALTLCENYHTFFDSASTSRTMEKASGDLNLDEFDIEQCPLWLQQYMIKMKHEIKKEVLDELLQVSQGELPTIKPGAASKVEENQSDFQGEVVHAGIFCDNCDQLIHGIRYKCGNCSDFDLCQECESLPNIHNKNHIFLKIRYPIALKMYLKQKHQEIPNPGKMHTGSSRSRQTKKLYEAKFVMDETIPDSTVLPPSTKFVKSWRVVNSGTRVWTHATKLRLIQGSPGLVPTNDHVDVPHLKPGEEGIISVLFTTPSFPGVFRSHWNFCHKSRPFGDIVWCHIVVRSPEEAENENAPSEKLQSDKTASKETSTSKSKKSKPSEDLKFCYEIITDLFEETHVAYAWPFYKIDFSDYNAKIKTPMDLNTMKAKIEDSKYNSPEEFAADMRLIFNNCYKNCANSSIVIKARQLQTVFESKHAEASRCQTAASKTETRIRSSSESSSSDSEEDHKRKLKLQQLPEEVAENKQDEVSCIAQVLTAVKKEHDRGNIVIRKAVVSSQTATPNNTPFDLTPPKSPDHHAPTMKDVHSMNVNNSQDVKDSDNDDDECSVVSLGSSESDTEFVVIPMPKCFNLSESFFAQHRSSLLSNYPNEAVPDYSGKNMHKMMQFGDQEVGIISAENMQPQKCAPKSNPLTSGTVSQETGVPELSVISCDQYLDIVEKQKNNKKTNVSVVTDGSSSEVSIIESGDNSPTAENATQTIGSVNISVSSEGDSGAYEGDEVKVSWNASNDNVISQEHAQNEPQPEENPSSMTFPKFPIEFVNSTYDPSPASNEERTVQVLPEGLVTGALSAAASLYNTARAVISTVQQPRNAAGACLSQELPQAATSGPTLNTHSTNLNPMEQLIEMGFCNRQQNESLLKKHNGDLHLVVAELVSLNDNDWYASRHIPSPPPFD